MKGYKAFHHGFYCEHKGNRKQYAENSIAEDTGADGCCQPGVMHYCETPLDTLDYYPLFDSDGNMTEFAEVEPLDEVFRKGNKRATRKLKIGAKLSLKELIKAQIDIVFHKTESDNNVKSASGDFAQLAASGNSAQLAASGDSAKLAASGHYAQLAASGHYAQLAASGYSAKLAASGYSAKLAASGDFAKLAASGDSAQLAASGYSAKLAASGYSAKLAASGDFAKLAASGDSAQLAASGDFAQFAASGNSAQLAASGDSAKLAASGNFAQLAASGKNSVVAGIGRANRAKAALGNWIVLAEYGDWNSEAYPVLCVKAALVDGKSLKPDTWYMLKNGEFKEVK